MKLLQEKNEFSECLHCCRTFVSTSSLTVMIVSGIHTTTTAPTLATHQFERELVVASGKVILFGDTTKVLSFHVKVSMMMYKVAIISWGEHILEIHLIPMKILSLLSHFLVQIWNV
jgi:hypothetical protein